MTRTITAIVVLMIAVQMTLAFGQGRQMPYGFEFQEQQHKIEIQPLGGYVWTVSKDATVSDGQGGFQSGSLDFKNNPYWGIEVDINIPKPGAQLALLYRRQETTVEWKPAGGIKEEVGEKSGWIEILPKVIEVLPAALR